jgi:light-regulated signal transduction histidine kinase (bacteriophytochrome)
LPGPEFGGVLRKIQLLPSEIRKKTYATAASTRHRGQSGSVYSLTISPVRNAAGKIIGASKIARDITERKRSDAQIVNLAREAEHRVKNILATVQAAVHLSHANTTDDLKELIEGRINALAKVHVLFVQSRWTGAGLHSLSRKSFRLTARTETDVRELTAQT